MTSLSVWAILNSLLLSLFLIFLYPRNSALLKFLIKMTFLGKNFNKNCQIIFKSVECDWQGDATIHTSFFHKEHLVISTPKLHDTEIYADFPVKVHIQSQGKILTFLWFFKILKNLNF